MKHSTHKLAAAATVGALTAINSSAFAQNTGGADTLTTLAGNIADGSGGLIKLITMVSYVGGIGLGVAGIFKLKQHVDNPGQTPMKDGLVRLGAGGGLLSLPFMTDAMQGTISAGQNTGVGFGTYSGLDNDFGGTTP